MPSGVPRMALNGMAASWMRPKAKSGMKGRRKLSEAALPKRAENWVLRFQIRRSWARTTGTMTGRGLELP
jgi:hypothetical protein